MERVARLLGFAEVHLTAAALRWVMTSSSNCWSTFAASKDDRIDRNDLGAAHLAFLVPHIDELYERTSTKSLRFINPPKPTYEVGRVVRKPSYPRDPDGKLA